MAESTRTTVGFVKQSSLVVGKAHALKIISQAAYAVAATMLSGLKALGKEIDEHHDEIISTQKTALATAREKKALYKDPVIEAIDIVKTKSLAWDTEQREKAEKERLRLQAIEDKRVLDEQAANKTIETDLRKAGNVEAANQVKSITVPRKEITFSGPKEIPGQKFKDAYGAEVTSLRDLAQAWLEGKVDPGAIQANETLLGQMARNEEKRKIISKYPGVKVWKKRILASI